ncbi:NUDIX hydrolase [Prauserella halophila]|uniref:NUDIX hydrolase n=1 Tax=Prauserella halophila TaxID=185641 RepID=A0ABN1W385_9PSEU|nr:NUDIX hydrolase [Prauserella halophila]MCP2236220.1 NUDIX domain-containing protein [Prauserella halophila]
MELLPFDEYVRSLPRRRMAAGVLLRDDAGRVLLVEPSYKRFWDIPGGVVEAGEPPWDAAAREVREEIGLDRRPGPLLVIDNLSATDRMPDGLMFVWDGGPITASEVDTLTLTDPEIVSASLHTPEQAAAKVPSSLAARLDSAVHAADTGTLALCQDGHRTTA